MKKDIKIPVSEGVYIAIVHEWNEDFLSKEWNSYVINDNSFQIEMVLVVTNGYDNTVKTSTMRHGIGKVNPKSFSKIELIQEEVLKLNNEFYVTYYIGNTLYEKKFLFKKNSINDNNMQELPVMEIDGIIIK
jgi:hypothetical protein